MADGTSTPAKTRRRARKPALAPTTPDPVEIAMEAEASGKAPVGEAAGLLADQRRLIRWQIASERTGVALKALTAVAGVAVAVGLAAMAWDASRARGLVVEAFSTPVDLAATGATGEVIARMVLDRLGELDRASNSLFTVQVSDGWTQDTTIEVPQTGVSVGEIQRLLRRWLGHETHLTGEVVRTPSGLRLTARTGAGRTVTVEGPADALPQLARQAAEAMFAEARPTQYAEGLIRRGEIAPGRRILAGVLRASDDPVERASAQNLLGIAATREGRMPEARDWFRRATASPDPTLAAVALGNVAWVEDVLGRLPQSMALNRQAMAKVPRGGGKAQHDRRALLAAKVAFDASDYDAALRAAAPLVGRRLVAAGSSMDENYAMALAALHQPTAARRYISFASPTVEFFAEDWPRYLVAIRGLPTQFAFPRAKAAEALALVRLGRTAEAQAIVAGTPMDCWYCVIVRGVIAGRQGDAAASERWFAQAHRDLPDSGIGLVYWGRARLDRGDADGALELFRRAGKSAPRWADPLFWQGDILLTKGDARAAADRFARAAPLAPRWGALHLRWGEALARLGRAGEARAKWRAATAMDLTPDERVRLTALLAGAKPSM